MFIFVVATQFGHRESETLIFLYFSLDSVAQLRCRVVIVAKLKHCRMSSFK